MDWALLTSPDFGSIKQPQTFSTTHSFIVTAMLNYDLLEDTDVELADLEEKDKRQTITF